MAVEPPVNLMPEPDFLMRESLSPFDLGEAVFHLAQKPFIVVQESLNRLLRQGPNIAAGLASETGKLGLQIGIKVSLHGSQSGQQRLAGQLPKQGEFG